MGVQPFLRGAELLVVAAERRAAIARNETGRVVSGGTVEAPLVKRQAHQRLDASHVSVALDKIVFIVQRDFTVFQEMNSLNLFSDNICVFARKCLPILLKLA